MLVRMTEGLTACITYVTRTSGSNSSNLGDTTVQISQFQPPWQLYGLCSWFLIGPNERQAVVYLTGPSQPHPNWTSPFVLITKSHSLCVVRLSFDRQQTTCNGRIHMVLTGNERSELLNGNLRSRRAGSRTLSRESLTVINRKLGAI